MEIRKLYGVPGAREAEGIVIIVDIIRAATTAACALSRGARYLIPVATGEEAFELRKKNPHYLIMGEDGGYKIEGFDYGNSPVEILKADLQDRIIVQRTSHGTQGLVNALKAKEIIFGSFSTVTSIKNYINSLNPDILSIVAMGGPHTEDDKFAFFLEQMLTGENPEIEPVIEYLKSYDGTVQHFLDPACPGFLREDFDLCLKVDIVDFVTILEKRDNMMVLCKKMG